MVMSTPPSSSNGVRSSRPHQEIGSPELEWGPREPACDARALEVAGWLQARLPNHTVLLFGSRARGDYKPHSDIDLIVLGEDNSSTWPQGLHSQAARLGLDVDVMSLPYDWEKFLANRDSPSHLAGAVQRDGLNPDGRHLKPMAQNNPWPGIQASLKVAQDALYESLFNFAHNRLATALTQAHHALENALKALYAVHRGVPPHIHTLKALGMVVRACEPDIDLPSDAWLDALTELRRIQPCSAEFGGGSEKTVLVTEDPQETVEAVQYLCGRMAEATLRRMDKEPRDVGYQHWEEDAPFGGLEYMDPGSLDRFERGRQEERQAMLRQLAEMAISAPTVRDRILQRLDTEPPDRWPSVEDIMGLSRMPPDPDDKDITPLEPG